MTWLKIRRRCFQEKYFASSENSIMLCTNGDFGCSVLCCKPLTATYILQTKGSSLDLGWRKPLNKNGERTPLSRKKSPTYFSFGLLIFFAVKSFEETAIEKNCWLANANWQFSSKECTERSYLNCRELS